MNTNLGKNAKNDFKKDFFKLMNIIIFGKAMKNVKKHRDNKLVTKEARRNCYYLESQNQTIIQCIFFRKFISLRNVKKNTHIPEQIYLYRSINIRNK